MKERITLSCTLRCSDLGEKTLKMLCVMHFWIRKRIRIFMKSIKLCFERSFSLNQRLCQKRLENGPFERLLFFLFQNVAKCRTKTTNSVQKFAQSRFFVLVFILGIT
jgi:hypothetical protein